MCVRLSADPRCLVMRIPKSVQRPSLFVHAFNSFEKKEFSDQPGALFNGFFSFPLFSRPFFGSQCLCCVRNESQQPLRSVIVIVTAAALCLVHYELEVRHLHYKLLQSPSP